MEEHMFCPPEAFWQVYGGENAGYSADYTQRILIKELREEYADCIFRERQSALELQTAYLDFLRMLLKDKAYVPENFHVYSPKSVVDAMRRRRFSSRDDVLTLLGISDTWLTIQSRSRYLYPMKK